MNRKNRIRLVLAFVGVLTVGLCGFPGDLFGADALFPTNYIVGSTADSIYARWWINGVLTDSTSTTDHENVVSYDTTWTITDGDFWLIEFMTFGVVWGDSGMQIGEYEYDNRHITSGAGAYAVHIVVVDSGASPDSVVGLVPVYVNNLAQNMTPYQRPTLNTGIATFNLPVGDWVTFTTAPGFAPVIDTFEVTNIAIPGGIFDTIFVYRDAGNRTTVAWYLKKANGQPYSYAVVKFNLRAMHPYDSMLVVSDSTVMNMLNYEVVDTADVNGLLTTPLWANSLLLGDSSYYAITARDRNGRLIQSDNKWKWDIPDADTTVWVHNLTRWK